MHLAIRVLTRLELAKVLRRLPDRSEQDKMRRRLEQASWPAETFNGGIFVHDPSQNAVFLTAVI